MDIIFHLGLHCTDEDRLRKTLANNHQILLHQNIMVPPPVRYRRPIRNGMARLANNRRMNRLQDELLEEIIGHEEPERLILCSRQFLGAPQDAHGDNKLYPKAHEHFARLRDLFPDHHVEFHFALRDLATFFPEVFKLTRGLSFEAFMGRCDLRKFSWTELVLRLRQAVPDEPFVIWANEDTPLIWPEILETVSGVAPNTPLEGRDEMLAEVMKPGGFKRLTKYLSERPPDNLATYARVASVFLEKYFDEGKMEEEYELPGWTEKVVDYLSKSYEQDIEDVADIPGVDMINVHI